MKESYQRTYSISMDDLVEVWAETFHPIGVVLVIYDASRHFNLLKECGVLVNPLEAYKNKVITVELPGIMEAYELMDNIQDAGYYPIMQVYREGKLVSDNVEP